jgi:hypothetical protein
MPNPAPPPSLPLAAETAPPTKSSTTNATVGISQSTRNDPTRSPQCA